MDFPKVPSFTPAKLTLQLRPRWFLSLPIQTTESKARVLYLIGLHPRTDLQGSV